MLVLVIIFGTLVKVCYTEVVYYSGVSVIRVPLYTIFYNWSDECVGSSKIVIGCSQNFLNY